MKCIRCGGCCKAIPCWFAQITYQITEENKKPCPALSENPDGTCTCLRMAMNDYMRWVMLGTGCHTPEFRIEKVSNLETHSVKTPNATEAKNTLETDGLSETENKTQADFRQDQTYNA